MKISIFSTHEMKYIWYSPQKISSIYLTIVNKILRHCHSLILSIQAADKHHVQRMAVTYIVYIYLLLAYKENTCLT